MGEDSEEDGFESDDIGWEQQFPQDDADFEAFVARQQELDKQYADIESRRKAAILSDEIDSERQQDGVEGDGSARSAPVALKRKRRPKLPVVVIIGRPNVGKSQLMNRIAGDFKAGSIVQDVVGITRDRTYRPAFWAQYEFSLVDTGGLIFDDDPTQAFIAEIRQQALIALEECKAAILVVDGQAGLNPLDEQIASFLRKEAGHVPVTVAVNKCESDMGTSYAADFWSLGLGEPFPVSALHGTGTGDLLDNVVKALPVVNTDLIQNESLGPNEEWLQEISVAIVGKPNAGKSSILNKLLGKERAIVSTIAGTTRDTVDDVVIRDHAEYRLLDTAGIRRKKNIKYGTEFFMINRAFKSIRRSDVALLVIDVMDGVTEQDRKIAERIIAEGRACIIVVNKWDLYEDKTDKSFTKVQEQIRDDLPMLKWAPITLVSALTGKRIPSLLQMVDEVYAQYRRRVSTAVLNEALEELVDWHKPPSTATAKQGKVYFCTQVASAPPTIAMFVNSTKLFSDNYKRYTDSKFRSILGFEGTPLRILWRTKT
ncbi:GTPase Der [Porphyridium purpureum]|uniref:GTPase Der n=1 Tax=Porphyridium purpureum TaxID=35688 RepID=A0A5J4YW73_PORPP|nr:GTPase Der [Porphyridium purpureum]|eukprot:POR7702..scf227_4